MPTKSEAPPQEDIANYLENLTSPFDIDPVLRHYIALSLFEADRSFPKGTKFEDLTAFQRLRFWAGATKILTKVYSYLKPQE